MEGNITAMEAARQGRREQLEVLEEYLKGEAPVAFTNHQGKDFEYMYDPEELARERAPIKVDFDKKFKLLDAVQFDQQLAEKLLEEGVDINARFNDGLTALHHSCIEGNLPMATLLLDRGANPTSTDSDGWTPLHAAAATGNWRLCKKLLSFGADPTMVTVDLELPLDLAEDEKAERVLQDALAEAGYDDDEKQEELRSRPAKLLEEEVNRVCESGQQSINEKNSEGATLLHICVCNGQKELVTKLLAAKADPNVPDVEGDTPVHLAVFFGHVSILEALVAAGGDLHKPNRYKEPPMHLSDDVTMIRVLQALARKSKPSTHEEVVIAPQKRERVASVSKKRTVQDKKLYAKMDVINEHKKIESAYAELHFPRGKPDKSPSTQPKKADPPKKKQPSTVYSEIDYNATAEGKDVKDLYATPQKVLAPELPEKLNKSADGSEDNAAATATTPQNKAAAARKMDSMVALKGRRPTAFDTIVQEEEAKEAAKKKGGCCVVQ